MEIQYRWVMAVHMNLYQREDDTEHQSCVLNHTFFTEKKTRVFENSPC